MFEYNLIGGLNNEKWLIVVSDSSSIINKDEFIFDLSEAVKEVSKVKNLFSICVVGISMDLEFKRRIWKALNFNKSCYLDYENIEDLRKYMLVSGEVQAETNFPFEKYAK